MTMAAGRKGGRRRRGVPRYGAMADINMTPFIDVMLVLLIIFMVAAPLLATAIGLFAAIPALIAYNKLQGDVAKAQARMESFADEFSSILSRQIDQHLSNDKAA